jgi:prepilin signal peptidase PulO-like enzyme (type II secretory pathway)
MKMLEIVLIALVGLVAGGMVNALADDLPHHRWPSLPRYPDGSPRPTAAWLGIGAFVGDKRTSSSGARLGWRYPLTEILTAGLMLLTYVVKRGKADVSDLQLLFWLAYMPVFVLITIIDLEHKLILFSVIIPASVLAILDAILTPIQKEPNLERALLGGAVGFGTFFILYLGGILYVYLVNRLQGRGINTVAFGYGDVMMALFSGLVLGLEAVIFALFITVFLGAIGSILYLIVQRLLGKGYTLFTALPYGPYIVAGTVIMLLFSAQVRFLIAGY